MVNVAITAQRVADRVRVTLAESTITAEKAEPLVDDAITHVENELGVTIGELAGDAGSKTLDVLKKYAPVITDLAAIYLLCHLSGGTATGMKFTVGPLNAEVLERAPQIEILANVVTKALETLKTTAAEIPFIVADGT